MEKNEEWNNFLHRVNEVTGLVKDMSSGDRNVATMAKRRADEMLAGKLIVEEDVELKVKTDRTVVNHKAFKNMVKKDGDTMDPEVFMAEVSRDADKRAADRKVRRERADTFRTQAIKAFKRHDYERALSCYNKAIEQIKDSSTLYMERALTFIKLGKYEKVIPDCDWTVRLNENSFKAHLYRAKAYKEMEDDDNFEKAKKEVYDKFAKHEELIDYFLNRDFHATVH